MVYQNEFVSSDPWHIGQLTIDKNDSTCVIVFPITLLTYDKYGISLG